MFPTSEDRVFQQVWMEDHKIKLTYVEFGGNAVSSLWIEAKMSMFLKHMPINSKTRSNFSSGLFNFFRAVVLIKEVR